MSNTSRSVCLIPARGGSKRIPKKNIVDFMGKPLIAHTIEAAKSSGLFGDAIYVSSDAEDILAVAEQYGAKAVKRPDEHATDTAGLEGVTLHLLEEVGAAQFENLCMLMPNCPLRTGDDIKDSHRHFVETAANCMMSVLDYHWLYPFWALEEKNNTLEFFFGKQYLTDSKNLPKVYCPSGAIRWVKVNNFLEEKKYYGKTITKYVLPFEQGVDIDTYEDLELAKKLYPLAYPAKA